LPEERPVAPLRGYKLAHPLLAADGTKAAFRGLSIGGLRVYGEVDDATCLWSGHQPPKRHCTCGFYCFHELKGAEEMACDTRYRGAVILEVEATSRFIRYEDGLRYGRQRVRAIRPGRCRCYRPASVLVDSGTGVVGWRQLAPSCLHCAGWSPATSFTDFAMRVGQKVRVIAGTESPSLPSGAPDSPSLTVLAGEVALLQARIDELQVELGRLSGAGGQ
jgi:hypothetical protein